MNDKHFPSAPPDTANAVSHSASWGNLTVDDGSYRNERSDKNLQEV